MTIVDASIPLVPGVLGEACVSKPEQFFEVKIFDRPGKYGLNVIGPHNPGQKSELNFSRNKNKYFTPAMLCEGYRLSSFLDSANLEIEEIAAQFEGEHELIRVRYRITPNNNSRSRVPGSCVLQPDLGWALREFESSPLAGDTPTYSGKVTYKAGSTEAIPDLLTWKSVAKSGFTQLATFQYKTYSHDPTPESEFTLRGFGLGDAVSEPQQVSNPLPTILIGVAIAALALSVIIKLRWRGRDQA